MTTTVTMHLGDVRDVTRRLIEQGDTYDLLVTSPPFLALRSYLPPDHPDKHREIGAEPTPAAFLDTLYGLTADWSQMLPEWASICVELGDTMSGSGTTAVAAALEHRDAVLIDLDERNVDLVDRRLRDTLHVLDQHRTGDTATWTVDAPLPDQDDQVAGQLTLLDQEATA